MNLEKNITYVPLKKSKERPYSVDILLQVFPVILKNLGSQSSVVEYHNLMIWCFQSKNNYFLIYHSVAKFSRWQIDDI